MASVLTARIASITPVPLRVTATNFHSFTTPAIYVPYPSGYGNQRQIILSGLAQARGSVTVGGKAVTASQTGSSYWENGGGGGGFPTWAIATVAAVGGALVVIFLVLLILICRRRSKDLAAAREARYIRASTDVNAVNEAPYTSNWFGIAGAPPENRRRIRVSNVPINEKRASSAAARRLAPHQAQGDKGYSSRRQSTDPLKDRTSFFGAKGVPVPPERASRNLSPNTNRRQFSNMPESAELPSDLRRTQQPHSAHHTLTHIGHLQDPTSVPPYDSVGSATSGGLLLGSHDREYRQSTLMQADDKFGHAGEGNYRRESQGSGSHRNSTLRRDENRSGGQGEDLRGYHRHGMNGEDWENAGTDISGRRRTRRARDSVPVGASGGRTGRIRRKEGFEDRDGYLHPI